MSRINTRGIAIHSLKYTGSTIIGKILTRECGYLSFFIRTGKKKPMSQHTLQALTLLEMEILLRENKDLQTISDQKIAFPLSSIQTDIGKSAQAIFMAEVLYRTLEDSYTNPELFDFVWNAVLRLESEALNPNFHLKFMLELSGFYGFYPQSETESGGHWFDYHSGLFVVNEPGHPHALSAADSENFQSLVGTNFDDLSTLTFSHQERKNMLAGLIEYFQIQVSGMKPINSHTVLETIFQD